MRELPVLFQDGSAFDEIDGIKFKGYSITEVQMKSPKAKEGHQPLPEAMWWLLMTGRFPTESQVAGLQKQWRHKGMLSLQQVKFILSLPNTLHPMTMLSMTILYLQRKSQFFNEYQSGVHKSKYWQLYFQDSMNLLAKLPRIAAVIYRHRYKNSQIINADNTLDWAANFAHMLGYDNVNMREVLRGYLSIHCDYEGGNVSAHAAHLVGSALADPYLCYSAAVNGLAGPLHGLTNQEGLKWLQELREFHKGQTPSKQIIEQFVHKTLSQGRIIPGYGHALLNKPDPRLVHLQNLADRTIHNDPTCQLAKLCFQTVPSVLSKLGKIKNPYPNVDAYSGCLLNHYGIKEYQYYTVVFAVSRALGCLADGVWARAYGLPIQRPNSINMDFLDKIKV